MRLDVVLLETGAQQPRAVDALEIDMELVAAPLDKAFGFAAEPTQDGLRHVAVGFEAARPDRGAQRGADICGGGAVGLRHRFNGAVHGAERRALPARVHRAHAAADAVIEQDGAAVGGERGEREVRHVGEQGVGVIRARVVREASGVVFADELHRVPVHLPVADGAGHVKPCRLTEQAVVREHVFWRVAVTLKEVERIERRGADAAEPRREGVANAAGGAQAVGGIVNKPSYVVFGEGHRNLISRSSAYTSCRCRRGRGRCARSSAPCAAGV